MRLLTACAGAGLMLASLGATAYASYDGRPRDPGREPAFEQVGVASWYGEQFQGRRTASGAIFDKWGLTAAHRKLPLGTEVTVTNLENGKSVTVTVNDRGPYVDGRVIDLSRGAARELGMVEWGLALVQIDATEQQLAKAGGD